MSQPSFRRLEATVASDEAGAWRPSFDAVFAASPWPVLMLDHEGQVLAASDEWDASPHADVPLRLRVNCYLGALLGPRPWRQPQQADCQRLRPDGSLALERLHLRCADWGASLTIVEQVGPPPPTDAQTARLAALGFMVAGVCHEVTNPLTSLHSIVQILQDQKQTSPDVLDKGLRNIAVNVKRILDISRRLVTFARVGDEPLVRFPVDEAVDEALVVLRHEGLLQGIELVRTADATAAVLGNIGQAREIFLNLFINAVQAMGGHGSLRIGTRRIGASVEVSVADSGPGVPEGLRERIFEPFFTTKGDTRGTGLGLAISREIALEHGGDIELRPTPAPGACFVVVLPKAMA